MGQRGKSFSEHVLISTFPYLCSQCISAKRKTIGCHVAVLSVFLSRILINVLLLRTCCIDRVWPKRSTTNYWEQSIERRLSFVTDRHCQRRICWNGADETASSAEDRQHCVRRARHQRPCARTQYYLLHTLQVHPRSNEWLQEEKGEQLRPWPMHCEHVMTCSGFSRSRTTWLLPSGRQQLRVNTPIVLWPNSSTLH